MDPDASDEMTDHLVDFFDRIAPSYDGWAGGQHEKVAARLVEVAGPHKGEHALDVGTGTGLVAHLVAPLVSPAQLHQRIQWQPVPLHTPVQECPQGDQVAVASPGCH